MGNAAFRHVAVSLLDDAQLDQVAPGTAKLLQAPAAKLVAGAHAHPNDFNVALHLQPNDTEFLCIRMQKVHQLQLRALFHACKKAAATAAADAARTAGAAPAPLPRVPVLCVRVVVHPGVGGRTSGLKSAYLAADKPFPTRKRHTWVWEAQPARGQTAAQRREQNMGGAAHRTQGHQELDRRTQADQMLPPERDVSLGESGCIFDLPAQHTDFFCVQDYFLTLNAAPKNDHDPGSGIVHVEVSASVALRTVAPPKHEVAKATAAKAAVLSAEQQAIRAANAAAKAALAEQAKATLAAEKEVQRLAELEESQRRRRAETEAAESSAAIAADRSARAIAQASALAAALDGHDAEDPFAPSVPGSSRSQSPRRHDDPFADEPSLSGTQQRPSHSDPFASLGSTPPGSGRRHGAGAGQDPFASFPPTPVGARPVAALGGGDVLDELESAWDPSASASPLTRIARGPAAPNPLDTPLPTPRSLAHAGGPNPLDQATPRPSVVLSADILSALPSRRVSPAPTPTALNSLSLASTPAGPGVGRPVERDLRVLDHLPSIAAMRVAVPAPAPPTAAQRAAARAELSVPLSSLPDRPPAPPMVDVLAGESTPRPRPAAQGPPAEALSAMPTPVFRPLPLPQPALLDAVQPAQAAPARPNPRLLDGMPSPAVPVRPAIDANLDAQALPPLHLSMGLAAVRAPPAGPDALDESFEERARNSKVAKRVPQAQRPLPPPSQSQRAPLPVPVPATRLDDSSDSLFGDPSPQRPRQPQSQLRPSDPFDDSLFDDGPSLAAPAPRPAVAAAAAAYSGSLDDVFGDAPAAAPSVKADLNVLDEL